MPGCLTLCFAYAGSPINLGLGFGVGTPYVPRDTVVLSMGIPQQGLPNLWKSPSNYWKHIPLVPPHAEAPGTSTLNNNIQ